MTFNGEAAVPNVEPDRGMVAVMREPYRYCAEGADNAPPKTRDWNIMSALPWPEPPPTDASSC